MTTTIPRAELLAIGARYNDSFDLDGDPTTQYARDVADYYRNASVLISGARSRESLLAEADDLDALADRYEQKAAK